MITDELVLDGLAAEFAERRRRGEQPTIAEYQRRHPALAAKIADRFTTVVDLGVVTATLPSGVANRPSPSGVETEPLPAADARRFGEYRVIRELGRGGMGIVYLAEQPALRRQVAIKTLPSAHADQASRDRFAREARLAARLIHPGIVAIHGVGEDAGTPWIAMQLVAGCSLDEVIQALDAGVPLADDGRGLSSAVRALRGGWGPSGTRVERRQPTWCHRVAVEATLQAADALRHAHEHGVLHRDIKPANLLVDADGRLLVSDFGLATAGDEQQVTSASRLTGTLQYVAPERFHGVTDERSDVYSLGLVLYELLALKPAFDQPSQAAMLRAVLDLGVPPPRSRIAGLAEPLERVLLRACARDPQQRYPSMAAFGRDLRALHAGHAPSATAMPRTAAPRWFVGAIAIAGAIGLFALRTTPAAPVVTPAQAPTASAPTAVPRDDSAHPVVGSTPARPSSAERGTAPEAASFSPSAEAALDAPSSPSGPDADAPARLQPSGPATTPSGAAPEDASAERQSVDTVRDAQRAAAQRELETEREIALQRAIDERREVDATRAAEQLRAAAAQRAADARRAAGAQRAGDQARDGGPRRGRPPNGPRDESRPLPPDGAPPPGDGGPPPDGPPPMDGRRPPPR